MIRLFQALFVSLCLLFLPASNGSAAEGPPKPEILKLDHTEPSGDWTLHCGKDQKDVERCILGIGLWDEEKRRIAGIVLQKNPEGSGTLARFSLPLGISLLNPAALQMGEKIYGFPITHCDQQGCHGNLLLNDELVEQFRFMNEGFLLMKLLDDRTLRIPFSLRGTHAGILRIK